MSTIKSSTEHLTLNADGSGKDIKFQANGVEKASISSTGAFTSTSIDATKLSGALPAIDGSALTGVGITEADQWRLTADFAGSANPIASNLERVDTTGFGKLGTGMTQSSGVFTFPSTGIWKIEAKGSFECSTISNYNIIYIWTTINNSTFLEADNGRGNTPSGSTYTDGHCSFIFDVTDTSTHKVRFRSLSHDTASITRGDSNRNETCFTFVRLGDT